MRVPVIGRRRNERGATAILVAALSVVLVGMAAFTVDFGQAYASKRQLQSGADAAVLAAAAQYADKVGDCVALDGNTAYEAVARADAEEILEEARPAASIVDWDVDCRDGELYVATAVQGQTPGAFGGVFGSGAITTQRAAEATVEVAETAGRGVRPYMMCSQDIPNPVPSGIVRVDFGGQAGMSEACPTAENPGNWWTVNCPEDFSNSTAVLEENTRNGCDDPVSIVDPQDGPDLTADLLAGCDGGADEDCLNAVTGNIGSSGIWDAWNSLLGKRILVPVFCGEPTCDPAAVAPAGGGNVNYPVHRFAAVVVCGYHWGSAPQKTGISTSGDCTGNTLNVTDGDNQDNYILLGFTAIQVSGSTRDGDCALGDSCDLGARQVRLTK